MRAAALMNNDVTQAECTPPRHHVTTKGTVGHASAILQAIVSGGGFFRHCL